MGRTCKGWLRPRKYGMDSTLPNTCGYLRTGKGGRVTEVSEDYFVFGLRVRSELALPELGPAGTQEADAPLVTVRTGSAGREIEKPVHVGPTFQVGMDDYLLD